MTDKKIDTTSIYERLSKIDISGYVERKAGLSYLSWARAWSLLKKEYPLASYEIQYFDGKPYNHYELGYMVFTSVTINDLTINCHLPVLDSANKPILDYPYTYKNKAGKDYIVEKITIFDINTTIMRCLAKNIALHGLGISLYVGEDLHDTGPVPQKNNVKQQHTQEIDNMEVDVNDYVSKRQAEVSEMAVVDEDKICPKCGSSLVKRNGARGEFWGCSTYPHCNYTQSLQIGQNSDRKEILDEASGDCEFWK